MRKTKLITKRVYALIPDHVKDQLVLSDKQRFYLGLPTFWNPNPKVARKFQMA